jgi:hypothetical protein
LLKAFESIYINENQKSCSSCIGIVVPVGPCRFIPTEKPLIPDPKLKVGFSDFIVDGKYDMKDVIQPIYDATNKEYGLNEKQE